MSGHSHDATPAGAPDAEWRQIAARVRNWGRWGAEDELGTLNHITPDAIRHAATLARTGKVISLGVPFNLIATAINKELGDGTAIVEGSLHLDEVRETTGFEVPEGPYETLAGFVLAQLGHIPVPGERVVVGDWRFEVLAMDRRRIARVDEHPHQFLGKLLIAVRRRHELFPVDGSIGIDGCIARAIDVRRKF